MGLGAEWRGGKRQMFVYNLYPSMKSKLIALVLVLLLLPALHTAQASIQSNTTQSSPQEDSQPNLNEFQVAQQQIKNNIEKLKLQQQALSNAVEAMSNIKNDFNSTITKYSQSDVQEKYKKFLMDSLTLIIENIVLLVAIVIVVLGIIYLLAMYFLRSRAARDKGDMQKVNEIYVESEHSSSTNLEGISQRSSTEPTL